VIIRLTALFFVSKLHVKRLKRYKYVSYKNFSHQILTISIHNIWKNVTKTCFYSKQVFVRCTLNDIKCIEKIAKFGVFMVVIMIFNLQSLFLIPLHL
jgi:hypothetical protein